MKRTHKSSSPIAAQQPRCHYGFPIYQSQVTYSLLIASLTRSCWSKLSISARTTETRCLWESRTRQISTKGQQVGHEIGGLSRGAQNREDSTSYRTLRRVKKKEQRDKVPDWAEELPSGNSQCPLEAPGGGCRSAESSYCGWCKGA